MFHKYYKYVGIFHYVLEHIKLIKDFFLIIIRVENMKGNKMHLLQMKL